MLDFEEELLVESFTCGTTANLSKISSPHEMNKPWSKSYPYPEVKAHWK